MTMGKLIDAKDRKEFRSGTHRLLHPEQTLALVSPYLRASGITRVAVVTGLDQLGIPVVMVTRPAGRSLSVTQGKGATLALAKVSGIMEAIEHHHAESIELPLLYMSERELEVRKPLVAVERLQQHGAARPSEPLLWVAGRSLHDGAEQWLPYECVHLDYRLPLPAGSGRFFASSNGLASGNSLNEAVCHGLFELIERHQVAAFYALDARSQHARRVDIETVNEELCCALIARIRAAGVRVALWDLSDELGVPCFLCDLLDERRDEFRVVPRARGMGCHGSKEIALVRALCEAAQSRLTLIAGSRDDISRTRVHSAMHSTEWNEADRQVRKGTLPERDYTALSSFQFDSFAEEACWLVRRLAEAGFEQAVAVDLSKPNFPIHVARVVVPGLRIVDPSTPAHTGRAA